MFGDSFLQLFNKEKGDFLIMETVKSVGFFPHLKFYNYFE